MKAFVFVALLLCLSYSELSEEQQAQFNQGWLQGYFNNQAATKVEACLDTLRFYGDLSQGRVQFQRYTLEGYIDGFKSLQPCFNFIPSAISQCIQDKTLSSQWLTETSRVNNLFIDISQLAGLITRNTIRSASKIQVASKSFDAAFSQQKYLEAGGYYGSICKLLSSQTKVEENIDDILVENGFLKEVEW